jgi:hypothetical protein
MAGMVCLALLAAVALAGAQTSKQTERKGKAPEADKQVERRRKQPDTERQVERKGKVIEADKQTEREGGVIEADKQTERKGRVIEADKQMELKKKAPEADRQAPRGAKSLERGSKKNNQNELLSMVIEADDQEAPGVIRRDYRQSKKEQPDRVRAIPGQGPVISPRACPDPAARSIEFTILSRTTARSGRVRIEGVVRNIGNAVFQSSPDAQSKAQLWQIGTGAPRLVAEKSFTALLPELIKNQTSAAAFASPVVRAPFERDWDSRSPNLGEFPPTYRLVIVLGGSVSGNGQGSGQADDCNLRNNVKERSGADINSMFRQ